MAITTPPLSGGQAASIKQLDPAKYSSLGDFLSTVNAPDNRDILTKTYGDQSITGFLKMTGAVKSNGSDDSVQYWEESRLHSTVRGHFGGTLASGHATATFAVASGSTAGNGILRNNDVVLINGQSRALVDGVSATEGIGTGGAAYDVTLRALTGSFGIAQAGGTANVVEIAVIGNLYAQGTDQPSQFLESNVIRRENPYMILKETFKVSGSQATNIGYINVGNGDYRWYVKGEMDTRQRFMDKREMMMLLGQDTPATGISVDSVAVSGSEGYFAAIQDRGIVAAGGDSDFATLADIDAIVAELDKQGAAPEYACYMDTTRMLAFDDMIASGGGNAFTNGAAAFGSFQNDPDAAVRLGFTSFRRGGYTFHNKAFRLLNDPTLLGAAGAGHFRGVMIPLTTVVDPKTGNRAAALEMNFKAANGYSREMEHWMTGSILGVTNANVDTLQFNYRSECNLITRAANQHVLLTA
jgi:hypothetical protein|tara:strand:- start:81 stop:1487 length:1407 start_codon:yes stop_codon:yes gene_type:complete